MRVCAVICEFDPLHLGHEHLLHSVREAGAECIVCIMSGDFCQRGEPSSFDAHTRTKAALAAGADLVLELPFPYSCASAEFFAYGAVSIIKALGGVDTLAFGCECADGEMLSACAELLLSDEFSAKYDAVCKSEKQTGTAAQIQKALEALSPECASLLCGANNTLAIEYIKAAKRTDTPLEIFPVARVGSGHGDMDEGARFASASLIRQCVREGKDIRRYLPEASADIICEAVRGMPEPPSMKLAERAVIAHLRAADRNAPCAGGDGGLFNRLCDAADKACSLDELFSLSKTKKYTDARLRRTIIFSMCRVTAEDLGHPPAYITLYGADSAGIRFLSERKKHIALPFISNPSMLSALRGEALHQLELSKRAAALRAVMTSSMSPADSRLRIPPVIVK